MLYLFGMFIGIIIIFIRTYVGEELFGRIALRLVPIITVFIVKFIVNKIAASIIFLRRDTEVLALNNFRAYNIFLYFYFYFDCFMGFLSAIVRLIKAVIAAVIMMPRISYSFMGRHLERKDNGYSCYSGFLHMEASKLYSKNSLKLI